MARSQFFEKATKYLPGFCTIFAKRKSGSRKDARLMFYTRNFFRLVLYCIHRAKAGKKKKRIPSYNGAIFPPVQRGRSSRLLPRVRVPSTCTGRITSPLVRTPIVLPGVNPVFNLNWPNTRRMSVRSKRHACHLHGSQDK